MFYPTIREEQVLTFNAVLLNLEKDPNYLNNPDCPYSDAVKAFFRKKIEAAAPIDIFADGDELVVLDQQIVKLMNDLETFAATLGSSDHSEKLAYFKTKTTLVEKLLGMRERVFNLKEINEFRLTILQFMDEVCSKDQITDLMHRLDGILGTKTDDIH